MTEQPTVALIGALDTKGQEYAYLREQVEAAGGAALLLDTGVLGTPGVGPDVSRQQVARAGEADLDELARAGDRSAGMQTMARGASALLTRMQSDGQIQAVLAVGGSNAAYVMSVVAGALPIGFPKLLVSTIAAGDTTGYVGQTDLTLMYPVVDINGLNRISRPILRNAAAAAAGMAQRTAQGQQSTDDADAALVAVSMFGVTTACGRRLAESLTGSGHEPLTFHMTGVGGRTMEALIADGLIQAVADLTTTELADDLCGGVCTAGPDRLTAAGRAGVPQVVSLGALDMVNFGGRATVPEKYAGRLFHEHNPEVTLMRTNAEEGAELGRRLAAKLNAATGPTALLIPERGFSQISVEGMPFHDPEADAALIEALTADLDPAVVVEHFDTDINDPAVADAAAAQIETWLKGSA